MPWTALPTVNALLNATSAIFLALGYAWIRRGRREAHRACMIAACAASALFLAGYLAYHAHAGSVRYPGDGADRAIYLAILLTHTLLAVAVPPLAAAALILAFRKRYEGHRRVARILLPLWAYVSVTGVAIYFLLYHFAGARPLP